QSLKGTVITKVIHFNLLIDLSECNAWETHKKWKSLNFTIARTTKLFLKLEDFFWKEYVPLKGARLPYSIEGNALQLRKLIMSNSSFVLLLSLECKRCVVVGNSYAIKNTSLGNTINKYDVVIRLNNAPIRGYEEDVGNKTTIRIFYPESASPDPGLNNEADTLMVMVPFKSRDLRWLKEILYDEKRVRKDFSNPPTLIWLVDSSKVRVLDPHFMHQTANKMLHIPFPPKKGRRYFHPTTGLLAVFVALNYCDVVHLAGFGYPPRKNLQQPIHYFGQHTMKAMMHSPHEIGREGQALKRLEEIGALMYLHPHL
uniref:CMP-N-acetylneuraminate-beta-galactosamide-alpha-2,3-sialyltransferase 4 n=1 Tax=Oryzias latipes TaxID=8090 RepID=A0A3P9JMH5_ORYLA